MAFRKRRHRGHRRAFKAGFKHGRKSKRGRSSHYGGHRSYGAAQNAMLNSRGGVRF